MRFVVFAAMLAASMMLAGCAAPDDAPLVGAGAEAAAGAAPEAGAGGDAAVSPEAAAPWRRIVTDERAVAFVGVPGVTGLAVSDDRAFGFFAPEGTARVVLVFEMAGEVDPTLERFPKAGYTFPVLVAPDGSRVYPDGTTVVPLADGRALVVGPAQDRIEMTLDAPVAGDWGVLLYGQGAAVSQVTTRLMMEGHGAAPELAGWKSADG